MKFMQYSDIRGITLIEAIVTMFIATVGLLSLGAAQLKSLQYAHNSFNYTIALVEANNAVETIWPDATNFFNGTKTLMKPISAVYPPMIILPCSLIPAHPEAFVQIFRLRPPGSTSVCRTEMLVAPPSRRVFLT